MAGRASQVAAAAVIAAGVWGGATRAAGESGVAGFIETARGADIVFLGEVHDNPVHHRNQAEIVAALSPAAIVFEMIPQEIEAELNALRDAGADHAALAEALGWSASGWPDFETYAAIMDAAPQARVFGAGQAREAIDLAVAEGAAEAFGPDAELYGLETLDDEERALREARQRAAHCDGVPAEALAGMVEAERFRAAGLADAALWARIMTGDGQVVVLSATALADKALGAPGMIARAAPEAHIVALGQFETTGPGQAPAGDLEAAGAFDAVLRAEPPARSDPCAGLHAPGD